MAKLVYNIEPASPSMISSLDRHCLTRVPDGSSNIVTERSHLNRMLQGDVRGLTQSLKNFYARGVQRPAAQSEKPYLRIVLSASPEYFRPDDPEAIGTWDEDRLLAWVKTSMNQLREEHGADLVFAELHLDEDTPHIHAVVAPTYTKKPRKPGRPKRGETPEQFEERKALALASKGVRTVGRASHATLSKKDSFQRLRERMTVAVDHLGIEYGEDRSINAPAGQSTREWVIQQAAELREEKAQDAQDRQDLKFGMRQMSTAMELVQKGTFDNEFKITDLPEKAKHSFATLAKAAPANKPTTGFVVRYLAFYDIRTGYPRKLSTMVSDILTTAFDKVRDMADLMRKTQLEAQETLTAAQTAATASTEAAKGTLEAYERTLHPYRVAVEAVAAWEVEKERSEWWDMTPEARLAAKDEERKVVMRRGASDDEILKLRAETFQLQAEMGTIIKAETIDHQSGRITGEDLRTGEKVVAHIILDEEDRVKHYPGRNQKSYEGSIGEARRALRFIKDKLASLVAGSIVYLEGLKADGTGLIAKGVHLCDPPRVDPRLGPPAAAQPLLDLPDDAQAKVRQAFETPPTKGPSLF